MSHATEPRAVLDTTALVSALLFRASTPRRALDYAFEHDNVLISLPLLRELYRVLHAPRLTRAGNVTTSTVHLQVGHAPDDTCVLALARSVAARTSISSGDRDLLTLGRYDSIPVRTLAQFLQDPSQP
jgi:predicted nucleic acid-binding protein